MIGTVTQHTSNTVVTGNVITQDPASGNSLPQGSPVNLVISSGPQMATVPNVEGLTQDAATSALAEAKLIRGTLTQETSNTVATGKVIRQDRHGTAARRVLAPPPGQTTVPAMRCKIFYCMQSVLYSAFVSYTLEFFGASRGTRPSVPHLLILNSVDVMFTTSTPVHDVAKEHGL